MRLELTGRHVEITPALRRLVDTKLVRLERLLNDAALSAQAVLSREKHRRRTDITLHARGEKFLHGFGASATWEASLATAVDKIAQQASKLKGKWRGRKRKARGAPPGVAPGREPEAAPARLGEGVPIRPAMPRILRTSRLALKAMSVGEAARQVDADGDGIVVFRDAETAAISVLYRRRNGELALVETAD
jgi:putative sigma-54 modulation protein